MNVMMEGKGKTIFFQTEFGTLITQLLTCFNQKIEESVNCAVKMIVEEFQHNLLPQNENEIEAGFISRSEAIKFLQISAPTLYRYQKEGLLPYHKVGRRLLFNKNDLLNATKVIKKKGKSHD